MKRFCAFWLAFGLNAHVGALFSSADMYVRQTYTLEFVEPTHRPVVAHHLNEMVRTVDRVIEALNLKGHISTLLSSAGVLCFSDDMPPLFIQATRGRNFIFQGKERVDDIDPTVFCASDRENFKEYLQGPVEDFPQALLTQHNASLEIRKIRNDQIFTLLQGTILAELLPVVDQSVDSQRTYVDEHIDDGEGTAVDQLVVSIKGSSDFLKYVPTMKIVYPLFFTERDACRCCLLSVRDYLSVAIKDLAPRAVVQPIIASRSIYHEKRKAKPNSPNPKVALRCFYPWYDPSSVANELMLPQQESEDEPPPTVPTVIFLCRLLCRE